MVSAFKSTVRAAGSVLAIAFVFTGCATSRVENPRSEARRGAPAPSFREILANEEVAETQKFTPDAIAAANPREIIVQGVKLQNTDFDFPIVVNSKVEQWVDYFTGRGRKHFERYLERSEFFIPYITPILRENGMPEDLVYLAMIESGFHNHAASHAKAVGPWQFISATGKRYGLAVNWWIDERRDTRKSTLAAVGYLKDLYGIFKSWELAAAGYNAGEAKVARAIQRYGTRDFWALSRYRYLRSETRNYVPKIIAAALVAKNRTQFGFAPPLELHQGEAVAPDGEVVKVERASSEVAQSVPKEETLEAILTQEDPTDAERVGVAELKADPSKPLARMIATPQVSKKGEASGVQLVEIEVQSPADLLHVATAAGLTYQTVKSLNPDLLRWVTPPMAKTYRIKLPFSVKDRFLENYNNASYPRKVQFLTYKARPGDSLQRIARHFGIRVDPIADLNRLSPKAPLRAGTLVLLPMPVDRSRSLASLEVRDPAEKRRVKRRKPAATSRSSVIHRNGKISLQRREAARAREPVSSRQ